MDSSLVSSLLSGIQNTPMELQGLAIGGGLGAMAGGINGFNQPQDPDDPESSGSLGNAAMGALSGGAQGGAVGLLGGMGLRAANAMMQAPPQIASPVDNPRPPASEDPWAAEVAAGQKVAALTVGQREQNKMDAANALVTLPIAGLATGAALRSILGLNDMFHPPRVGSPHLLGTSQLVQVPGEEEEEPLPPKPKRRTKVAAPQANNPISQFIYDHFLKSAPNQRSLLAGDDATNPAGVPLAGLALPATLAAGALGYKGVDSLVSGMRRKTQDQDLEDTKRQYEAALFGKNAADQLQKSAEDILARLEKQAGDNDPAPQSSLPLPGLRSNYLSYALGSALAAALVGGGVGYNAAAPKNRRKILDEALRRRALAPMANASPVFAYSE